MSDFIPSKRYISFKHLEARTPEQLERMMLEITVKAPYPITFSPPTFNGRWHTWYLFDWSNEIKGMEKLNIEGAAQKVESTTTTTKISRKKAK